MYGGRTTPLNSSLRARVEHQLLADTSGRRTKNWALPEELTGAARPDEGHLEYGRICFFSAKDQLR